MFSRCVHYTNRPLHANSKSLQRLPKRNWTSGILYPVSCITLRELTGIYHINAWCSNHCCFLSMSGLFGSRVALRGQSSSYDPASKRSTLPCSCLSYSYCSTQIRHMHLFRYRIIYHIKDPIVLQNISELSIPAIEIWEPTSWSLSNNDLCDIIVANI